MVMIYVVMAYIVVAYIEKARGIAGRVVFTSTRCVSTHSMYTRYSFLRRVYRAAAK